MDTEEIKKGKSYACRNKKENRLRKGDLYPTPKSLVWCAKDLFCKVIPKDATITEPCCANGALTNALWEMGFEHFIENDLFSKRNILHEDILATNLDEWASEYVVTNFPFSKWDDCVSAFLAKKHLKALVTIGRLNYLSTQSRLESPLWKHLKEVWVFSRYVDYRTPERDDGCFNVGAMATGWFYFTKEEIECPKIRFVDVSKYAKLGNIKTRK